MKLKMFVLAIVALGAVSCGENKDNYITFKCDDLDFKVSFVNESAKMIIDNSKVDLNIAVSASGARYTGQHNGKEVELWTKGDSSMLKFNGKDYKNCNVMK